MTPAQRLRREQDLVMAAAVAGGASMTRVGRAFGLSRWRVSQVLKKLAAEAAKTHGSEDHSGGSPHRFSSSSGRRKSHGWVPYTD